MWRLKALSRAHCLSPTIPGGPHTRRIPCQPCLCQSQLTTTGSVKMRSSCLTGSSTSQPGSEQHRRDMVGVCCFLSVQVAQLLERPARCSRVQWIAMNLAVCCSIVCVWLVSNTLRQCRHAAAQLTWQSVDHLTLLCKLWTNKQCAEKWPSEPGVTSQRLAPESASLSTLPHLCRSAGSQWYFVSSWRWLLALDRCDGTLHGGAEVSSEHPADCAARGAGHLSADYAAAWRLALEKVGASVALVCWWCILL